MKLEINEVKKLVDNVDGWLSYEEGELLYGLAKKCAKGAIVEIGSWKGKSTIWLANGSKAGNGVKVYAIDPHTGSSEHKKMYDKVWTFEDFRKNIRNAQVDDIVVPIVKTSEEAARYFDKPVELVFIDGAHEYEMVKSDFKLWFPKIINRGVMAFHDTTGYVGPKKVVEEFVFKTRNFRNIKFVGSITFAERGQASIKDYLKNRYVLLSRNLIEFTRKLHLPKTIRAIGKNLIGLMQ